MTQPEILRSLVPLLARGYLPHHLRLLEDGDLIMDREIPENEELWIALTGASAERMVRSVRGGN